MQAMGYLEMLNISGFVFLQGSFAFQQGSTQTVKLSTGASQDVTGFTIGGSNINAFVGTGNYFDGNGDGVVTAGGAAQPHRPGRQGTRPPVGPATLRGAGVGAAG